LFIKSSGVAHLNSSYSIFSLGDSAITIDLGNCIDESLNTKSLDIHNWLQARTFTGLLDIVAAYSSVTIFYDPAGVALAGVAGPEGVYASLEALLRRAWEETPAIGTRAGEGLAIGTRTGAGLAAGGRCGEDRPVELRESGPGPAITGVNTRIVEIPVCYEGEYAPDLEAVALQKGLSPAEVIHLHTAKLYRVYMIGFLPGFPYLGRLDTRLGLGRKPEPQTVRAGGVGIAGMQTGIYPLESPGGWWIIGRTPFMLFDAQANAPTLLCAGDSVRFRAIPTVEFREIAARAAVSSSK
jgi:inhibitor of KinA